MKLFCVNAFSVINSYILPYTILFIKLYLCTFTTIDHYYLLVDKKDKGKVVYNHNLFVFYFMFMKYPLLKFGSNST